MELWSLGGSGEARLLLNGILSIRRYLKYILEIAISRVFWENRQWKSQGCSLRSPRPPPELIILLLERNVRSVI